MSNEIKNIVFDFNGVISKSKVKDLINQVSFKDVCSLVCFGFSYLTKSGFRKNIARLSKALKTGQCSSEEFYEQFDYSLPNNSQIIQKLLDTYINSMQTREGLIQLIDYLRNNGFKVFILSNSIPQTEIIIKSESISSHFDGIYCSNEHGLAKPDPSIYKHACELWGILPEESIFVDDKKENVLGAEKAGFKKAYYLTKEDDIIMQVSQCVL